MTEDLTYDVADGVGRLTFNRPDQRNALTFAMYDRLREICAAAPADGSLRALILSGAGGRAFAAGTDMTQFRAFETAADAHTYEARIEAVIAAVEACPIPTIAAITGACTGGGASIAAACDLRVSDARLKFGFPIARTLGNCLAAANLARLSALIGPARVKRMVFLAELMGAEDALACGLIDEIAEDPLARAEEMATTIAGHAPLTLRATKEALRRNARTAAAADDRDLIELCYMSDDFREGMEAFLGKRTPVWKGR
jgi:enoyl-CoA hydratase/carnithine racemase